MLLEEHSIIQSYRISGSRMHCRAVLFLLITLLFPVLLNGQDNAAPLRPLEPGQQLPDLALNQRFNMEATPASLAGYRGKLLILDFWASWCAFSSVMFGKADKLEEQFQGRLVFLPVSYQSRQQVGDFLTLLQKFRRKSAGSLYGDTTLTKLFPHTYLPHYVWISPEGRFIGTSTYEELREETIRDVLAGKKSLPAQKKEVSIPYNDQFPLHFRNNGGEGSNTIYRSLLTSYTEGLYSGWHLLKSDSSKGRRIVFTNQSLPMLYRLAFSGDSVLLGANRLMYCVKDSAALVSRFSKQRFDDWKLRNMYCYELSVPAQQSAAIFSLMKEDLGRFFPGYRVKMEKQEVKCLALVRTGTRDRIRSKGGKPEFRSNAYSCSLRNVSLGRLVAVLNTMYMQHLPLPVVDATGYPDPVDLELNASMASAGSLNAALEPFGLRLEEQQRSMDMLVFRDHPLHTSQQLPAQF